MNTIVVFVENNDKNSSSTMNRVINCAKKFVLLDCVRKKNFSVPREETYSKGPCGKPYFKGSPIHFNVSHSGKYWVCAMSVRPVGIDIQQKIEGRNLRAIADRFFTTQEADYLFSEEYRSFYDVWAAKESYVKYTGTGIANNFDCFSVVWQPEKQAYSVYNSCQLRMLNIDSDYSCSLCGEGSYVYRIESQIQATCEQ